MKTITLHNDLPLLPATPMRAGSLHCLYEHGTLRFIRRGNTELVRMIYCAVRNASWETAPYTISDEIIDIGTDNFEVRYTAYYTLGDIRYTTQCHISGTAAGTILFSVDGVAQSDFLRNRIGICVHHPLASLTGRKVWVTHDDGSQTNAVFPRTISPHQPFTHIREMAWSAPEGYKASLRFTGEVFETEDQRNWSDASFKTYGTPLALPMPVEVRTADRLQQSVQLEVKDASIAVPPPAGSQPELRMPFPAIGYCVNATEFPEGVHTFLQQVPCRHLYVHLVLSQSNWQSQLVQAGGLAVRVPAKLVLAVVFGPQYQAEITALAEALAAEPECVQKVLVLEQNKPVASRHLFNTVTQTLAEQLPGIDFGFGTDGHFAELNRNMPEGLHPGFASFSLNPQVHASDTRSIWENLGSHRHLLATLAERLPGVPVHVGPLTLHNRAVTDAAGTRQLPPDERQYSVFTAMWTLAAIGKLAGAAGLSMHACFGKGGLVDRVDGNWVKSPLFEVLRTIHAFDPVWVIGREGAEVDSRQELQLENAAGERMVFGLEVPGFCEQPE